MSFSRTIARYLTKYDNNNSLGFKLRAKRIAPLVEMIQTVFENKGSVNVIDFGGTEVYWRILPEHLFEKYNINYSR